MEILIWLTGGTIVVAMVVAYRSSRDPLHPLMYLGAMLLYAYAVVPALYYYQGRLYQDLFPDEARVEMAQTYVLLAIAFFCAGCLRAKAPKRRVETVARVGAVDPMISRRLLRASYVLAAVGIVAYFHMLSATGGLLATYSVSKGRGWASSGYITSAPLLTIPAVMLLFLSRGRQKLDWKTAALVLLYASPHIIHGFLGARRGAVFLALTTIVFGWYLAAGRRPSWRVVIAGVGVVGILMVFMASQRRQIYIGSDFDFDQEAFHKSLLPQQAGGGDLTTYTWALILMSDGSGNHGWGRRYIIHGLVRPIPKQLWRGKYDDAVRVLYAGKITADSGADAWLSTVGWLPPSGSAAGFVADSFFEFSWGGLILCFLLGLVYGGLWQRAVVRRGFWSLLYLEAAVVSVFLVTQGVASSWFYRLAYLGVPTYLLWQTVLVLRAKGVLKNAERMLGLVIPAPQDAGGGGPSRPGA